MAIPPTRKRFLEVGSTAQAVWAKSTYPDDGWLPLWCHMADSADVAGLLWDRWLPARVKALVADALPGGQSDARVLVLWLAAAHDIGKATPAFACQVEHLAAVMRQRGLETPTIDAIREDRKSAPHGLAGQLLLQEWLEARHGWERGVTQQFTVIIGGHHGVQPTNLQARNLRQLPGMLRTPASEQAWRDVQNELLDACAEATGAADRLRDWGAVKLLQQVQILVSALVIVADWIASDRSLFPLIPDATGREPDRAQGAWTALNLPEPWMPAAPPEDLSELFSARFTLPSGAELRPVQEATLRAAREMSGPGMVLVEAPMGEGKTEAALGAVEILAERTGAGGCFFALPTMATGNAMFSRVVDWLRRLPDARGKTGAHSLELRHSKSALNTDYRRLPRRARTVSSGIEVDAETPRRSRRSKDRAIPAELVAHHWLRGRKKGMLASFVVGTIDQLLFAGLKSRHLALRHLTLAGKIVVIDEVHAYDAFMNTYLDRVLTWLGTYGVPVIVLSATLPAARRRELIEAYAGTSNDDPQMVERERGYPLVTTVESGRAPRMYRPAASGRATKVQVERLDDDLDTLTSRLRHELREGGCAVVIRNTVRRVHETAHHLRSEFPEATVEVAHARFVDVDRLRKDTELLASFGSPDKVAELGGTRPKGPYIVVASQVVEQSLDIDFDVMVTDLAPIDLILQRMGRLHRHDRGREQSDRPSPLRTARCFITGADWTAAPHEPVPGSVTIYRRWALLRAAAVLEERVLGAEEGHIHLPDDISPLVQTAYGPDPAGPKDWQPELDRALAEHIEFRATKEKEADEFRIAPPKKPGRSLAGWVDAGVGDADDSPQGQGQVRDTDQGIEVLVVQRRSDDSWTTLAHLPDGEGGLPIPTDATPPDNVARIVAKSALRLPYPFTLPKVLDQAIPELEKRNRVPKWQDKECHWLAGELILDLSEECQCRLADYELTYSPTTGFEVHTQ